MTDRIQVLFCTYGHEEHVGRSLQSVVNQTHKDIDLIILNDCSPDRTNEIIINSLEALETRFEGRFTYLQNHENMGAEQAFWYLTKFYAAHPPSPYVCILEGDDFWEPDALEKRLKFLKEGGFDAVHTDVNMYLPDHVNSSGENTPLVCPNFWATNSYPIPTIAGQAGKEFLMRDNRIFTCTLLSKHDYFVPAYDYDVFIDNGIKLCDYAAAFRMVHLGAKIGYLPEVTAGYLNLKTSVTHSISHDKLVQETVKVKQLAASGKLFEDYNFG